MLHQTRTLTLPLILPLGLLLAAVFALAPPLPAAAQGAEIEVRGRVLLPDGSPATGAKMELVLRSTQQEPEDGGSLAKPVTVDEAGRFSISYTPQEGLECQLTGELAEHSPLTWDWVEHPADGLKSLAERRFEELLYITGSILDADGELQIEGWSVLAFSTGGRIIRDATGATRVQPDPATGIFRIGPLSPGPYRLRASSDSGFSIRNDSVHVKVGKQAKVLLRLEGSGVDLNRVTIQTTTKGSIASRLNGSFASELGVEERSYLFLLDANGEVLAEASQPEVKSRRYWTFEDVPAGEYAVELRHPLFEPVRVEGVSTGGKETIELVGNAAIELAVKSSEGVALSDYHVGIRYSVDGPLASMASPLLMSTATPEGGRRFVGIVPGAITLTVEGETGEQRDIEIGMLLPGETHRAQVQLAALVPMEVLVLDPDGQPLEGVELECVRGPARNHSTALVFRKVAKMARSGGGRESGEVPRTGADGRYVLRNVVPGQWSVRALSETFGSVGRTVEHSATSDGPVVIQLAPVTRLEGQLRCREGFDFTGIQVMAWSGEPAGSESDGMTVLPPVLVDREGRFSVQGLPLGEAHLLLQADGFPETVSRRGGGSISRTVEMTGGVQEWELDLEPLLRAACEVRLNLGGEPTAGMRIVLITEKRMTRYAKRSTLRKLLGNGAAVEAGSRGRVGGLDPGTVYTVFVVGADDAWAAAIGQVETKSYFEDVQLQGRLELVEREVLVQGAAGEGVPNTEFGWACRRMAAAQAKASTSAESKFTLRMPAGSYSLYRADQKRPALVPFEWQAGDGPLVIELPEDE